MDAQLIELRAELEEARELRREADGLGDFALILDADRAISSLEARLCHGSVLCLCTVERSVRTPTVLPAATHVLPNHNVIEKQTFHRSPEGHNGNRSLSVANIVAERLTHPALWGSVRGLAHTVSGLWGCPVITLHVSIPCDALCATSQGTVKGLEDQLARLRQAQASSGQQAAALRERLRRLQNADARGRTYLQTSAGEVRTCRVEVCPGHGSMTVLGNGAQWAVQSLRVRGRATRLSRCMTCKSLGG